MMTVQSFSPARAMQRLTPTRFGHQHGPHCQDDVCEVPKSKASQPQENWFIAAIKAVWNWIYTFITGPFLDLKAVHDYLVESTDPKAQAKKHVHGPNCNHDTPATPPKNKKTSAVQGHVHGPECNHEDRGVPMITATTVTEKKSPNPDQNA